MFRSRSIIWFCTCIKASKIATRNKGIQCTYKKKKGKRRSGKAAIKSAQSQQQLITACEHTPGQVHVVNSPCKFAQSILFLNKWEPGKRN